MADKTTIGISSLIALGIVLAGSIIPGFFDAPKYYCPSRPELGVVECDSFTQYVSPVGKCIRTENTNLICREGWVEVTNDVVIPEEETIKEDNGVWGKSYLCKSGQECVPI